jgi:hypothetical protein
LKEYALAVSKSIYSRAAVVAGLGMFVLTVSPCCARSQAQMCTSTDAKHAESEADTFRTWGTLYKSYSLYRRCDDGAIAEGYSESVARILVDHWKTLSELDHLINANSRFKEFVLRHIDSTLDSNDVKKISRNARERCPNGLSDLCNDLKKQADTR